VTGRLRAGAALGAIGIGLGVAASASAQSQPPVADTSQLQDIVVTAEKREESLQRTPASIIARSGEALRKAGVDSTLDLATIAPGVAVTTNTASAQIYIRGIGTNFGGDQSVALHVDGVYQVSTQGALQELLGVDRMEVLRGPQGTLYGRNATGGVVNIITRRPTMDLSAEGDLEYGNYNLFRQRALVNVPIVNDKVAMLISVVHTDRDGFRYNPYLNSRIDDEHNWGVRGRLLIRASDNLDILLSGNYSAENDSRTLGFKIDKNVYAPQVDLLPQLGMRGGTVPDDPNIIYSDKNSIQNYKQYGGSAELDWDLGGVKIKSLTAYQVNTRRENIDIDGTEVDYFDGQLTGSRTSWFSQELQVLSQNDGPLQWIAGIYYLRDDERERGVYTTPILDQLGFGSGPIGRDFNSGTRAYAGFGQFTYKIFDKLRLTVGARFSHERKFAVQYLNAMEALGVQATNSKSWNAFTPKFSIDYSPNDDVMFYASATRGFKSGGFNESASDLFDPEYIWSYEAGARTSLLDKRLRLNATTFLYNYSNIQVMQALASPDPLTGATTKVGNAASARVKGIELELQVIPLKGLELSANASLLEAKYRTYLSPNTEVAGNPIVDLSGNWLPLAPQFAGILSAQYTTTVGNAGTLSVRGDLYHQSRVFFTAFNNLNDHFGQQKGYELVNAHIGFTSADKHWTLGLFGRNLTNKVYKQTVIRALGFFGQLDILAPPRTYGVELGFKF